MGSKLLKTVSCVLICLLLNTQSVFAQITPNEKDIEVTLRMIGHQLLLMANDSSSRVLPIVKEEQQYKLQFEKEFSFEPSQLVKVIDSVFTKTNLSKRYIIEVANCTTQEIVYSFKVDELTQEDIVPCGGRIQPKGCYSLLVTFLDLTYNEANIAENSQSIDQANASTGIFKYLSYLALAAMLMAILTFLWKRKQATNEDPDLISLGEYQFDKRNTELILENQRIELTSKEADLLLLLYNSANTTVEREVILNKIWEDEGHYVGRTLDVFISKLRKKLEFDSKVKIVNIRGVGYKLVVNPES